MLWKELKNNINTLGTEETKKEWAEMEEKNVTGTNKTERKNLMLALSVVYPKTWQQMWASEVRKVDRSQGTRRESGWKYEGQMKKIFGEDWPAFKAKGKFPMKEDEDGDQMWQYNEVTKYKDDSLTDTAKMEKNATVNEEEGQKLCDAMMANARGSSGSSFELGGASMINH